MRTSSELIHLKWKFSSVILQTSYFKKAHALEVSALTKRKSRNKPNPDFQLCSFHLNFTSELALSLTHTECQRQRQRPMLVYGYYWEGVWDRFSSITIDQHWPLTLLLPLTLGVGIPLPIRYLSFTVIFSRTVLRALSRNCFPDWILLNFIFIFTDLFGQYFNFLFGFNFGGRNPNKPICMNN